MCWPAICRLRLSSSQTGIVVPSNIKHHGSLAELLDATLNRYAPSEEQMGLVSERVREEFGRLKQRAPRILVVDDKLDTLLLLRELLSSRGYEVITATEAEEAKDLVHTERPDLVLLDVVMPGKSGYEVCRELKDDPVTRLVPIV